jgi:hypothetical protein
MTKKCNKCEQIKDVLCFGKAGTFKDGSIKYMSSCKECKKQHYSSDKQYYIEAAKIRYQNNREEILEQVKAYQQTSSKPKEWRENNKEYLHNKAKEWYESNKDKALETQAEWRENNREYFYEWAKNNADKVKQHNRKANIKKRLEKPWTIAWRNQLTGALKRLKQTKQNTTIESLGYSAEQLREHIESLWSEGMNWDNYGGKRGCWEIDHKKAVSKFDWDVKVSLVNSLDNLQPMWVTDNRKKRNN